MHLFNTLIQLFTNMELQICAINDTEWELVECICLFLGYFENATKILSGTYYLTIHLAEFFHS